MADESYKAKFLESHNEYRKKHGAPEVTYNEELCSTAQKWADHLLSIKTLKHSKTDDGENVFYSWSSSPQKLTGVEAVESWYGEIKDYDFSKSGYQPKTGHFTQVVWKATTEIGLGFATDGKAVYVVGQYRTAGNITNAGYYEKNVLPLGSEYNAKSDSSKPQPAVADESYKAKFLESHNEYRKKHGAPEVTYNEELCSTAQKWADHLLSIKTLKHSKTDDGENVYYSWSSSPQELTGAEAVESWYSEIKDYDFSKSGYQPKTGHFTQVVWKATTEIGLGFATDGNTVFVVGQYRTAGNITNAGYYEENVLPLGSEYNAKSDSKPQPANAKSDSSKPQPAVADESYKAKFLESHNEYRKKHGAPEVTYNEELCSTAQKWADHLLSIKTLKHSKTKDGENVYYSWSSSPQKLTGAEAVESWYSEIKDYDFSKSGYQPKTGHFTQVVWKATTEIGLGFATDGNTVFVVGQYRTAGNITNAGYYEENVLPLGSEYNAKSDSKPQPANAKSDSIKPQPAVADESYKAKFLESHNEYRKKHGAPEVTYNEELCSTAQKWADHLLSIKTLKHSKTDDGENVYYSWSSSPKKLTGAEAVESWYSEIKDYDFSKSGYQPKTGHFTQVVWKATTEIGLGFATDGKAVFVVGQYRTAGNITNAGYYEENVLPLGSEYNPKSDSKPQPANAKSDSSKPQPAVADESYKAKFLESHNEYRKKHGAPEVTYNEELCSTAQKWADHLLSIKTLQHSETDDGENVYYSWSSSPKKLTGAEAVESWYSEIKDYDFSKSGYQPKTGHFTQVVWKATTEIGLGFATDGKAVFVVGQYRTAGNITNAGYYEENVLPLGSEYNAKSDSKPQPANAKSDSIKPQPAVADESYKAKFLESHNEYRKKHGVPEVTYNEELCSTAQEWADHLLSIKTLQHSDTDDGENVYYSWSSSPKKLTGAEAVESWYSEIKDYDFSKPGFQSGTGHFTQVVWKATTEIGLGFATDGNTVFVVGQYRPAGNMTNAGYFEKNVLPAVAE